MSILFKGLEGDSRGLCGIYEHLPRECPDKKDSKQDSNEKRDMNENTDPIGDNVMRIEDTTRAPKESSENLVVCYFEENLVFSACVARAVQNWVFRS
ncbi:uncharacterized protein G2W53_038891 [Senna tora]|uniref:Uncharacterized protein n=1 Tax=Senna tora TaxID=362788 RepID=A0A834SPT6_9FABA|nr:uncharacterized protein G2W53_038891 [Senna tora]